MIHVHNSLINEFGENRIKLKEPIHLHSMITTASVAEMYFETDSLDELAKIIRSTQKLGIPVYILGSGSQINLSNELIKGLVVKNNCRRFHSMGLKGKMRDNIMGVDEVLVYAESGALMNQLVRYTIDEGLEGLEYQLGLPGTVGGGIVTNAKYIPKYLPLSKSVYSIKILHHDGQMQNYIGKLPYFYPAGDGWEKSNDCILSVVFRLLPSDKNILWERGNEATRNRSEKKNYAL